MPENSTEEWRCAFATAWSQCLAAPLKYHSKWRGWEVNRGHCSRGQPWASMHASGKLLIHCTKTQAGRLAESVTLKLYSLYMGHTTHISEDGCWNKHFERNDESSLFMNTVLSRTVAQLMLELMCVKCPQDLYSYLISFFTMIYVALLWDKNH